MCSSTSEYVKEKACPGTYLASHTKGLFERSYMLLCLIYGQSILDHARKAAALQAPRFPSGSPFVVRFECSAVSKSQRCRTSVNVTRAVKNISRAMHRPWPGPAAHARVMSVTKDTVHPILPNAHQSYYFEARKLKVGRFCLITPRCQERGH